MPHQEQQADGTSAPRGTNNPGPSTNREPVPDGIEGSLTRQNVDQADGSSAVSPKAMKPTGGDAARRPDDVSTQTTPTTQTTQSTHPAGATGSTQSTQSKQFGDREEGNDRSVHNL